MNLHGLRLFYTVAKLGSVTLAVEKLMISQPAITVQLKKFEKENDIKLFVPRGRGICLTDIGEELFKEACAIFKTEDELWFVVSPDHKYANKTVSLLEIVNEPFIIKKKGSYARNILKSLCFTYSVKAPKIAIEFGELHETLMVLQQGYGVTFCQSIAVRELIELKKLARVYVDCKIPKNEIFMCVRKNEEKSYLVDKFIKSINI